MEITARALWTLIHGMGFGGLYLLACSGALVVRFQKQQYPEPASGCSADREGSTRHIDEPHLYFYRLEPMIMNRLAGMQ